VGHQILPAPSSFCSHTSCIALTSQECSTGKYHIATTAVAMKTTDPMKIRTNFLTAMPA
jgi:hypothetical protein